MGRKGGGGCGHRDPWGEASPHWDWVAQHGLVLLCIKPTQPQPGGQLGEILGSLRPCGGSFPGSLGKPCRVTAGSGTGLAGGTGRAGDTCGVTCPRPGPAQATRIRGTQVALRHPSGISGAPHLPPRPPPPPTGPMAAAGAHIPWQVMAEQGEEHREYQEYRRLEDCEEDSPPGEEEEEQLLLHVTEGPTGTRVPSSGGSRVPMVWGPQVGVSGSLWGRYHIPT